MIRSLKIRLALAGGFVAALAIGVVFLLDHYAVLPRLQAIENDRAIAHFEQAQRELRADANGLGRLATTWAARAGARDLVNGGGEGFIANELTPAAIAASDVDLIAFYTADRRVAWRGDGSLAGRASVSLPEFPPDRAPAWPTLLDATQERTGLLVAGSGPLFAAVRPIGDRAAPAGYVVLARRVANSTAALAAQVNAIDLALTRAAAARTSAVPQPRALSGDLMQVRGAVLDMFGEPNLRMELRFNRSAFKTGRELAVTNAIAMGGVVLGGLLLALLLVYRLAVRPTVVLARHARRVRESNDYSLRMDLHRRDEVGQLAEQFDRLIEQVDTKSRELLRLSNADSLTGIANRRAFDQRLQDDWTLFTRMRQPMAAIVCDVDDFKHYNDQYGHLAGDEALRQVALALSGALRRATDAVFRTGGEEFTVLLRGSDADEALQAAERLVEAVRALELPHPGARAAPIVTISAGVATMVPERRADPAALIQLADEALYEAKRLGRNRAVRSGRIIAFRPREEGGPRGV